jgi:hypothetical protein
MTILLMCGLAVIGAMPVFLLVASLTRKSVAEGQQQTMKFLKQWGGVAPKSVKVWIRASIGGTVGFGLLVALTFAFNWLGDQPLTTPAISEVFGHFRNPYTEWSVASYQDWVDFRDMIKIKWVKGNPGQDLAKDPEAWEQWKNKQGKEHVRIPRTLIWFSVLLLIAGLYDLMSPKYRRRGALLIALGAVSFVVLMMIWAGKKNHYVYDVVTANRTLGDSKVSEPESLKATLAKYKR